MFGPAYFRQVGWVTGDGEMIAVDELNGLNEVTERFDAYVDESRADWELKSLPRYSFDPVHDTADEDGNPITFLELVERELGARPLMAVEVDEIESERLYDAQKQLADSIAMVIVDTVGKAVDLVAEDIEALVDRFDAQDFGVEVQSDYTGIPLG